MTNDSFDSAIGAPSPARRTRLANATNILLAICCLCLLGCRDTTGRQSVSGEVSLNGEPLPQGQVSLRPIGRGPRVGGKVVDGEFDIERSKGPLPGQYAVSINSFQETGRMISPESNPSMKVPEVKQALPSKYNTRTELRMEVAGDGDNHFRFELQNN